MQSSSSFMSWEAPAAAAFRKFVRVEIMHPCVLIVWGDLGKLMAEDQRMVSQIIRYQTAICAYMKSIAMAIDPQLAKIVPKR